MRIIAGDFKGKKILQPKDKETRPLKDLTKESIFNIISHSNKFSIDFGINILDLFSELIFWFRVFIKKSSTCDFC